MIYIKNFKPEPQQPRPCLHCGTDTVHKKPFCSAAHKAMWQALNPGNGRYVHEDWHHPGNVSYLAHRNYTIISQDGIVRAIAPDYETIKDCDNVIDAKRAAAIHMREAA